VRRSRLLWPDRWRMRSRAGARPCRRDNWVGSLIHTWSGLSCVRPYCWRAFSIFHSSRRCSDTHRRTRPVTWLRRWRFQPSSLQMPSTSGIVHERVVAEPTSENRSCLMKGKPGFVFPAVADGVHREACGLTVPLLSIRHITRTQGRYPGPTKRKQRVRQRELSQQLRNCDYAASIPCGRQCAARNISAQTAEISH